MIPCFAGKPTMYFIGVTTGNSSIMRVFPQWMKAINKDVEIIGIDLAIHSERETYRRVVSRIKNDPLSIGALVTTHKIDIYNAASDLFDYLDPYALQLGELSSISKHANQLCGHAKDPISCGQALNEFVPNNYWQENPQAEVFIMGAGGSAISMCSFLMRKGMGHNYPQKITVSNRSKERLENLKRICNEINPGYVKCEFIFSPAVEENDMILAKLPSRSLIINATGLGKDAPGSPISGDINFPYEAIVWEINYRGDLLFMQQAKKQESKQRLNIHDGWMYFIYGWTQVISEVLDYPITDDLISQFSSIAGRMR